MPLIKCPECGKMISEYANACPNCGCPKEHFHKSEYEKYIDDLTAHGCRQCPACGEIVGINDRQCYSCGARFF